MLRDSERRSLSHAVQSAVMGELAKNPSPEVLNRIAREVREKLSPTVTATWDDARRCVVVKVIDPITSVHLAFEVGHSTYISDSDSNTAMAAATAEPAARGNL